MALIHCNFHSETLRLACSMDVILPQPPLVSAKRGPFDGTQGRPERGRMGGSRRRLYRTLYLLHGLSDDHTIWQRRTSVERYATPYGLAVVMPDAHRSFYTDMARGLPYWTFLSEELPALARAFFPLSDAREDNFVAGLSMGGYGAFKWALLCPDKFAAAASLSGALDVAGFVGRDRERDPLGKQELENIFGPASDIAGSPNDLFFLAQQLARSEGPKPALFQCCGTEDVLYADNVRFRDHARSAGLELTYEEGPGQHEWGFWDKWIQRVLAWLPPSR